MKIVASSPLIRVAVFNSNKQIQASVKTAAVDFIVLSWYAVIMLARKQTNLMMALSSFVHKSRISMSNKAFSFAVMVDCHS